MHTYNAGDVSDAPLMSLVYIYMMYQRLELACLSAPASRLALTYASSGKAVHDNPTRHVRQVEIEAVLREVEACGIKVMVIVAVTTVIAVRSQHHSQVTAAQQHECAMPRREGPDKKANATCGE